MKIYFPKLSLFASWPGAMNNPQWLELPISRTKFYGPKDVRAIKVRLYIIPFHGFARWTWFYVWHHLFHLIYSLWANSADDKLMIFFLVFFFSLENKIWHLMQMVFLCKKDLTLHANCLLRRPKLMIFFHVFPRKQDLTPHASCLLMKKKKKKKKKKKEICHFMQIVS